jgi:hypothetical protein
MAKKNNWNADAMQGSLISDMEQEVKNGYQKIGQGGGEPAKSEEFFAEQSGKAERRVKSEEFASAPQTIPVTAMIAQGEPTQNINVPIPITLHSRLAIIKAKTRQNMKDLVVLAIKEYVERAEQEQQA